MADSKTDPIAALLQHEKHNEASYWKERLCPSLTITEEMKQEGKMPQVPDQEAERRRQKLISSGYVLVDDCVDMDLVAKVRRGMESLNQYPKGEQQEASLPATFILLFDETWELARTSRHMMAKSSHPDNNFHFDLLAWNIGPGQAGFSPHRDRQPEDAASTFQPDGQAKFLTHWIALSDVTTEQSCLHVIPKACDPGYFDGDTDQEDPLRRALPHKETYQHIRALPRKSGQSILFTHRIIHWGSKGSDDDGSSSIGPRIAISFVCADPSYEAPLVNPDYFTKDKNPPFHIRLLLVCAQLLIYYQRFELSKEAVKACYDYCKQYEGELQESYRHKVFCEFVKAVKETSVTNGDEKPSASKVEVVIQQDDEDDDEEDAMMEEMLNAESGGYGEFEDDFDEMEGALDDDDMEHEGMEEDEEEMDVFGQQDLAVEGSNLSKKIKAMLADTPNGKSS